MNINVVKDLWFMDLDVKVVVHSCPQTIPFSADLIYGGFSLLLRSL